jgi:hypothetical protein
MRNSRLNLGQKPHLKAKLSRHFVQNFDPLNLQKADYLAEHWLQKQEQSLVSWLNFELAAGYCCNESASLDTKALHAYQKYSMSLSQVRFC